MSENDVTENDGSAIAEQPSSLLVQCLSALGQYPITALRLLTRPGKFFESIAGDDLHQHRLVRCTVFLVVSATISVFCRWVDTYSCPLLECLTQLIPQVFNIIGLNYAFAVIMHLILMLFGYRGAFLKTVESANYCSAQFILIAIGNLTKAALSALVPYTSANDSLTQWFIYSCVTPGISYVSILIPLCGCYIFFRGIRATGKISSVKSSIAIFVPVTLFFLPAIISAAIVAIALGMMTRH